LPELTPLSPILDDFLTGQCISDHHGVRCYPAIHKETEEKYIVKVISIPASDSQLEVLLMTGAVHDQTEALAYFTTLAQDVEKEAAVLSELSLLEGFLPCKQVQCTVTEDGCGYQIYLLTPYRRSVDTVFRHENMTHLAAVNMGMDLCAALAACRRAGYLYVDLKPENIYLDEKRGYCIGDLGFIPLSGLKYASLPDKYRSIYTAPEMADVMAELNTTLDIYALGLVLYQAYNGGTLPFNGIAPQEMPDPPLYADYEMAEIILRACCPDPALRWQDPSQMGQALVAYMQRNEVNDVPITPAAEITDIDEDAEEAFLPDMTEEELTAALSEEDAELAQIAALAAEDSILTQEELDSVESDAQLEDAEDMLAQAEELLSLVPPEPVVAPEAVEIPMPEPIVTEPPQDTQQEALVEEDPVEEISTPEEDIAPAEDIPPAPAPVESPVPEPKEPPKKKAKHRRKRPKKDRHIGRWIAAVFCILLIGFIGYAGYYYYSFEYLQNIDSLTVFGTDSSITVQIESDIDDVLLGVTCTDSYGNTYPSKVMNGTAVFESLNPQTHYAIKLSISGFHQLTGQTTETYTTASQTQILSFNAGIGPTDGSVILSFTAAGPLPDSWNVVYAAQGEEAKTLSFTGNTVAISNLTVGKAYTFTLQTDAELYVAGQTALTYTASNILFADNLTITECRDGFLTVSWDAPEGETVPFWTVHCYNASGYDETVIISECTYQFRNLDHDTPCTVEVTAVGMTQNVSTTICADPITIWGFPYTLENGRIQLSWNFTGKAPEGGWEVLWSVDGVSQPAIHCDTASAEIPLFVPDAQYAFTLEAADRTHIFSNGFQMALPDASVFHDGSLTAADIRVDACIAPVTEEPWTWLDLASEHFTSSFASGQQAYLLLTTQGNILDAENEIEITYVLRTADAAFLSCSSELLHWNAMWLEGGCLLKVPVMPAESGAYILTVYFNGAYVAQQNMTVS